MNRIKLNNYRIWVRLIAFAIITVFLCQDVAWAIDYNALAKESFVQGKVKNPESRSIGDRYAIYKELGEFYETLVREQIILLQSMFNERKWIPTKEEEKRLKEFVENELRRYEEEIFRKMGKDTKGASKIINELRREVRDRYTVSAISGLLLEDKVMYVLCGSYNNARIFVIDEGKKIREIPQGEFVRDIVSKEFYWGNIGAEVIKYYSDALREYHRHLRFSAKERLAIFIKTGIDLFDTFGGSNLYMKAVKEEGQGVWDELKRDNSLIREGLRSKYDNVRLGCLSLAGFLGDDSFVDIILPMLRDDVKYIPFSKDDSSIGIIQSMTGDNVRYIVIEEIVALGRLKARKAVPELIRLFRERYVEREAHYTEFDSQLFYSFFNALELIGGEEAEDFFIEIFKDRYNLKVRGLAVYHLGKLKSKKALPHIEAVLSHCKTGILDYKTEDKGYHGGRRVVEEAFGRYQDIIPIDMAGVKKCIYALGEMGGREAWELLKKWIEGNKKFLGHHAYWPERNAVGEAVTEVLYRLAQDNELRKDIEEKLCEWLDWNFENVILIPSSEGGLFNHLNARKCVTRAAGLIGTKRLATKLFESIKRPRMRAYAKDALAEVKDRDTLLSFIDLIKKEGDGEREETIRAIRDCKNPVMVEALIITMNKWYGEEWCGGYGKYAEIIFGLLKDISGNNVEAMATKLEDSSLHPIAMRNIVLLCGETRTRLAVKPICKILLESKDTSLTIACAETLGMICSPLATEPLLKALDNPNPEVQKAVVKALGFLGGRVVSNKVAESLKETDPEELKVEKIRVIGITGDSEKIPVLLPYLDDNSFYVRVTAVRAIALLGDEEVLGEISRVFEMDRAYWTTGEKEDIIRQLQMKSGNVARYGAGFREFIDGIWALFRSEGLSSVYGEAGRILADEMADTQKRIESVGSEERQRPGITPINVNSVTLLEDAFLYRSVQGTVACDDLVVSGFNIPEASAAKSTAGWAGRGEFYSSGSPSYSASGYLDSKGAFGVISARFYNDALTSGNIVHSDTGNWGHFVFGVPVPLNGIRYIIVSPETYYDYRYLAGLNSIEELDTNMLSEERKNMSKERLNVLREALRRRYDPDYIYLSDIDNLTETSLNRDMLSNGLRKAAFREIYEVWNKLRTEPLFGSVFSEKIVNVETELCEGGVLRKLDDLGIKDSDIDIRIKSAILGSVVKLIKNPRRGFLRDLLALSDSDFIKARRIVEETLPMETQQLKQVGSNHTIYENTWAHTMAAVFGPDGELEDTRGDIVYSIAEPVVGLEIDNINLGEGINTRRVIRTAMLLHDLGKLDDRGPGHVAQSAIRAVRILNELQFDEKEKDIIMHLIKTHQAWKELSLSERRDGEYDMDIFMKQVIEPMVITFGSIAGEMVKLSFLIDLCDINASPESRGILSGGRNGILWRLYEEVNKRITPANEAFMVGEVDRKSVKTRIREKFQSLDVVRYRIDGENLVKGAPVRKEGDTGIVVDSKGNAVFSEEIVEERDTQYELIRYGLLLLTEKEPEVTIVFLKGENVLDFNTLDKLQFAKRSRHEDRRQIILPYNILYLLLCIEDNRGAFEYILTYEWIRRNNMDASVGYVMSLTDKELEDATNKKRAFFELLQLAGAIEYIAQEIERHNDKGLTLTVDEDGVLRCRKTNEIEAILEIDLKQALNVRLGEDRLTYWDVLYNRLRGDKDTDIEIMPKGMDLIEIRNLLVQILLKRELIRREEKENTTQGRYAALSETNLKKLEQLAELDKEGKKTVSISSRCLLTVTGGKDGRYTYNQNATGVRYIVDSIKQGFNVEIINEQEELIEQKHMELILNHIFGIPLKVISEASYIGRDGKEGLLLLSEESGKEIQREFNGVVTIIGSRGLSLNVLLTFGIYKLSGVIDSEIKNMLLAFGYSVEEADEILASKGIIKLPPIISFSYPINTIAAFTRTIDIAA